MIDKQKYDSTIIELYKHIEVARKDLKETTEQFQETMNMVNLLKNNYEFTGKLFSSFDYQELFAHFKEQLNNNPKIRKEFIDFMRNNKKNLSSEEENALDFLSNNANKI